MSDDHEINSTSTTKKKGGHSFTLSLNKVFWVIIVIALCGLSFVAGHHYNGSKTVSTTVSANTAGDTGTSGGFGGQGGQRRGGGAIGTVTAVSPTSISINNTRTNATATYSISSSTTITNNGAAATTADIATGDTVLITVSGTGSTAATRILVNPSFGGGFGGGTGSGASGTAPTGE